jgi:hypothetical protein
MEFDGLAVDGLVQKLEEAISNRVIAVDVPLFSTAAGYVI